MAKRRFRALAIALALTLAAAMGAAEEAEDPVVAEVGGVQIHLSEAQPRCERLWQDAVQYGRNVAPADIERQVLTDLTRRAVERIKAEELGCDQLTDDELRQAAEDAEDDYQALYLYYYQSFACDAVVKTDARMQLLGYSRESMLEDAKQALIRQRLMERTVGDLAVDEATLRAHYEAAVEADRAAYEGHPATYEQARGEGGDDAIVWNPDGYRRVRRVRIEMDIADRSAYSALLDELDGARAGEAGRSEAEIQADIDALREPLFQRAQAVRDGYARGEDIDRLIAEYADADDAGRDYYVCADSPTQRAEFVRAALSVDAPGQLSEAVDAGSALYMACCLAEVTPGPVPYEDVRGALDAECARQAKLEAYDAQLDAWGEELGVTYYPENFATQPAP